MDNNKSVVGADRQRWEVVLVSELDLQQSCLQLLLLVLVLPGVLPVTCRSPQVADLPLDTHTHTQSGRYSQTVCLVLSPTRMDTPPPKSKSQSQLYGQSQNMWQTNKGIELVSDARCNQESRIQLGPIK